MGASEKVGAALHGSTAHEAAVRELAMLTRWAGGPRPIRPGCTNVSHDRFGFCSACVPTTPAGLTGQTLEVNAWRLRALMGDA